MSYSSAEWNQRSGNAMQASILSGKAPDDQRTLDGLCEWIYHRVLRSGNWTEPVADLEHDKIVKRLDELQHCLSGCHRARGFLDIERGREQSIRNAWWTYRWENEFWAGFSFCGGTWGTGRWNPTRWLGLIRYSGQRPRAVVTDPLGPKYPTWFFFFFFSFLFGVQKYPTWSKSNFGGEK